MRLADPSTTRGLNQKASDNPPLTAQWPHKVWLAKTGHWAEYDDLTLEQFVQGYIEIVLPTIPVGPSTKVARDHIGYLQGMMRDTSSSPWHLVRSTHKQILLMIEHKLLKWEDAVTRDSIRASQLLSAKEEVIQAKFLGLPDTATAKAWKEQQQQQQVKEEAVQPCLSYNTGVCMHTRAHTIDGTKMFHICSHCFKHGKHRHFHQESACHKKNGKARTFHHQVKDTHSVVRIRSSPSPTALPLPSLQLPAVLATTLSFTCHTTPSPSTLADCSQSLDSPPPVSTVVDHTQPLVLSQLNHGPVVPPVNHVHCGAVSDQPSNTPNVWPSFKQEYKAMAPGFSGVPGFTRKCLYQNTSRAFHQTLASCHRTHTALGPLLESRPPPVNKPT